MFKRIAAWLLPVAALVATAACSNKAGNQVITPDSPAAAQLQALLEQDPSLQELKKAGYTPAAVLANGQTRVVTYHPKCGNMSAQECSDTRPDATHPVVVLYTKKVGLNDPISFTGKFQLIYLAPTKMQLVEGLNPKLYGLYCRVSPPSQASTALPAGYIGRFAEIGEHFSKLEYSMQKGKTMAHSHKISDDSTWECTASTGLV